MGTILTLHRLISCLVVIYKCYLLCCTSGLMLCSVVALSRGSRSISSIRLGQITRGMETVFPTGDRHLAFTRHCTSLNGVYQTEYSPCKTLFKLPSMSRDIHKDCNAEKMTNDKGLGCSSSENYVFATVPQKGPKCTLEINWQGKRINLDRLKCEPVDLTITRLKRSLVKLSSDPKGDDNQSNSLSNFCVGFLSNLFKPLDETSGSNSPPTVEDALRTSAFISINDSLLPIYTNVPRLASVTTSERAMVGCPIFAFSKFTSDDCTSTLDIQWIDKDDLVLGDGPIYYPTEEDVGREIRAIVKCVGVSHGALESPAVQVTAAPECAWQKRRNEEFNAKFKPENLRVVSFNILSPTYMQSLDALVKFFPYCPVEFMDYNYRSQLVLKELKMLNGHITCLQECASSVYYKYMQPAMAATHHCLLTLKNPTVDEGCAMFVSKDAFDLLENKDTSFKVAICGEKYKPLLDRLTPKWKGFHGNYFSKFHTVYQFGAFLSKVDNTKLVLVANTHLYFHPHGRHVRLLQAHVLMTELAEFREAVAKEHGIDLDDCVTLICGDFNVFPTDSVYQLMTSGEISFSHPDWSFGEVYGPDDMCRFDPNNLPVVNSNSGNATGDGSECTVLKSEATGGYRDGYQGHPLDFTNFVQVFSGTLDYILVKGNAQVTNVLQGISKAEAQAHVALPCRGYPSDHLSIAVDLNLN